MERVLMSFECMKNKGLMVNADFELSSTLDPFNWSYEANVTVSTSINVIITTLFLPSTRLEGFLNP